MEKGKDYLQNFSPTPGIVIAHIITSMTVVNDLEVHSIDIEQVFLQNDKLMEGVIDQYFINPPPGRPDANNKDFVYEVLRPLNGNPRRQDPYIKPWMPFSRAKGLIPLDLKNLCGKGLVGENMLKISMCGQCVRSRG
jgi:hypothetical protein